MINDIKLSAIISTSDFAVLRSVNDIVGLAILPETLDVLVNSVQAARTRLNVDLLSATKEGNLEIDNSVDPVVFIKSIPDNMYSKLVSDLEDGWSSKILSGNDNIMANVGFSRRVAGYNSEPDELFTMLSEVKEMIKEKTSSKEEDIALARKVNIKVLAMCSPTGELRDTLLSTIVSE